MKLLFDKNDNGSDELKELIGYIDADFDFNQIKMDIQSATKEVRNIIGKETYDKAADSYQSEEPDFNLINSIRLPIATRAYMLYAPKNDLQHSNNGRTMRRDSTQTTPFQWMLERDDQARERDYYKSLDLCIAYLDENELEEWLSSKAYERTHKHFVRTVEEFEEHYNIDGSRYLLIKLSPGLMKAEQFGLLPVLGKSLFYELKENKLENKPPEDPLLLHMIQAYSVFKAMEWGTRVLSVHLFPKGIFEIQPVSKNTDWSRQRAEASEQFGRDARQMLNSIIDYLNADSDDNPDDCLGFFKDNDGFVNT